MHCDVYISIIHINDLSTTEKIVNANLFGGAVNLKSYTTIPNSYIFPSDGYVEVLMGGGVLGQTITATIFDSTGAAFVRVMSSTMASGRSGDYGSIFVKKGMKVFVTISSSEATSNASATFRAIN